MDNADKESTIAIATKWSPNPEPEKRIVLDPTAPKANFPSQDIKIAGVAEGSGYQSKRQERDTEIINQQKQEIIELKIKLEESQKARISAEERAKEAEAKLVIAQRTEEKIKESKWSHPENPAGESKLETPKQELTHVLTNDEKDTVSRKLISILDKVGPRGSKAPLTTLNEIPESQRKSKWKENSPWTLEEIFEAASKGDIQKLDEFSKPNGEFQAWYMDQLMTKNGDHPSSDDVKKSLSSILEKIHDRACYESVARLVQRLEKYDVVKLGTSNQTPSEVANSIRTFSRNPLLPLNGITSDLNIRNAVKRIKENEYVKEVNLSSMPTMSPNK